MKTTTRKNETMTAQMRNVLEAIMSQTLKTAGKNKGEVKYRIADVRESYDGRTITALERRDLIDWHDGIHGCGCAATKKAVELASRRSRRG